MNKKIVNTVIATATFGTLTATAGVPFNSVEGSGGLGYNPLAYTAGKSDPEATNSVWHVTAPQLGGWITSFHEQGITWTSLSAAFTVADRLELSYAAGEIHGVAGDDDINTHTLGAKLNLLPENSFDTAWVPAVSVGARWKHTDSDLAPALGIGKSGADFYVVATKLITQTPIPVLLSVGLEESDEFVYGVVGHNDFGLSWFGSVTLVPTDWFALGFEYKGRSDIGDNLGNANYYNVHAGFFVTDRLSVIAAYGYTGDKDRGFNRFGLGEVATISLQYQF